MLVVTGTILNLFFSPRQKLHSVTDVIKRNRNGSSMAASSRKSISTITATGATHGIVNAKRYNSITSAAGLSPTRPLAASSGLGIPSISP